MKRFLLIALISFFVQTSFAQKLYTSRNYEKAIVNKTRSIDGQAGERYWQNTSTYNIKVKIDPVSGRLKAYQTITYTNNSPYRLSYVCFNVFQNLYKKGSTRIVPIASSDVHHGVEIAKIKVNNKLLKLANIRNESTLMYLKLDKDIQPGATTIFSMYWTMNIPKKSFIKMCKYNSKSLFIANWFPKLAVYDDIEGWNEYTYNGLSEFYNDYSNYNVEIEVPENYIVQATGELKNAKSVLHPQINKRLNKAKKVNYNVIITSALDRRITNKGNQIWKFKANEVADFAFAISKNRIWQASSVKIKDSDKRILVDAVYDKKDKHFEQVINIAKETIIYMADEMPGLSYPYSHITLFSGHGKAEYPMIINNASDKKNNRTVYLTTHEIMHSIFPIWVGMSETKYAWFDEGFTLVFAEDLQERLNINANPSSYWQSMYEKKYASNEREAVLMTPSHYLDPKVYDELSNGKAGMALRLFKDYLGKEEFRSLMRSFIHLWENSHPSPYDFFAYTNDFFNTNMDWFWKKWFFEYAKADLSITEMFYNGYSYTITVENVGGLPLPVELFVEYTDGTTENILNKMDIWKTGNKTLSINHITEKKIKRIILGNAFVPDINKDNNYFSITED
ncbi:MAG: M1 family metallopeptidase [Marinifilaceae bacterium]